MARFLSPEWFAEAGARSAGVGAGAAAVLEQVVEGTPGGTVTYRVEVADGGGTRVAWPVAADAPDPDLRITCSWATAVAMAQGELSAQQALSAGRLRVKGSLVRAAQLSARLAGTDPLPAELRAATSY